MSTPSTKCPKLVDKSDPKAVASWIVSNWMATCDIYEFNNSHRRQNDHLRNLIAAELSELATLRTSLEKAKEALKPFARFTEVSETWPYRKAWPDDAEIVGTVWKRESDSEVANINCGHLRRASAVLKEIESV